MLTLTEEQLNWLVAKMPSPQKSPKGGRPISDRRRTLRGIFWMLDNGAKWKDLPREFGVRYHPNHVWRVLRELRWSCQVPQRRPVQRDQEAIEHWKRYKWPHIKKGARTWGPSGVPG